MQIRTIGIATAKNVFHVVHGTPENGKTSNGEKTPHRIEKNEFSDFKDEKRSSEAGHTKAENPKEEAHKEADDSLGFGEAGKKGGGSWFFFLPKPVARSEHGFAVFCVFVVYIGGGGGLRVFSVTKLFVASIFEDFGFESLHHLSR